MQMRCRKLDLWYIEKGKTRMAPVIRSDNGGMDERNRNDQVRAMARNCPDSH
jgi:hypothetical protein